jgi:hypothetical protein
VCPIFFVCARYQTTYQTMPGIQTRQEVLIYDPVFTDEDVILLCGLHFQTLTENKACTDLLRAPHQYLNTPGFQNAAYSINVPTLVFMPHCDISLYESLLRQNWSIESLSNMFFIANHFQEYIDRCGPFPCNR